MKCDDVYKTSNKILQTKVSKRKTWEEGGKKIGRKREIGRRKMPATEADGERAGERLEGKLQTLV